MNDVRAVLAQLVQTEDQGFYGDAGRVEARLQEVAGDRPSEIAVLVTAVRAGVVSELLGLSPGLFEISVGHLASRMVRLYGTDPAASRWAVEAWAEVLGVAPTASPPELIPTAPPESPPPPPPPLVSPEPTSAPMWRRLGWPGIAALGVAVVGLVALIVLVRLLAGLVHGNGGGNGGTSQPAVPASTPTTSVASPQASALTVPPGLTLGTGDVQVTVLWADGNDLDLHVVDPAGAEIYFSNPHSPSGGTLDHDDTAGCASPGTHVENVFWPAGGAPRGRYRVFVKNYGSCGAPSQYSLRVTVGGRVVITATGSIPATEGAESPPSEFTR